MRYTYVKVVPFILLLSFVDTLPAQEFKSDGFSRQINLPDNQGTVNINQYLVKSDDYHTLIRQLDHIDTAIKEKQEDCVAFETANMIERLVKCRESLAGLQASRDSVVYIITQFKEDVIRLAQTFEHISINSERLRMAKLFFDEGKFREVLSVMNTKEMIDEGEALLWEKDRFQSRLKRTDSLLQIKAEEFRIKAQAKAIDYTDPRRVDSTAFFYLQSLHYNDNVQTLYDLAVFFNDNHRYDSAFAYFPKLIVHPKAEAWQKANAYGNLGELNAITGDLPEALRAYSESLKAYESLYQQYPREPRYKNGLAICYQYLGITYMSLGDLPQALAFFERYNQLKMELYEAYSQNMCHVCFKNGLALSYQYLGEIHTSLGNLRQALAFFEQFNELEKELCAAHPQNLDFKNGLATSYQFLGDTYRAIGNLRQALASFEQYNLLEKELYAAYPQNIDFKHRLAISYEKLGDIYEAVGDLPQALNFFKQFNQLEEDLYVAYPQNVEFKSRLATSYEKLGNTFRGIGDLSQALVFFRQYNELERALYAAYPQNVDFKNSLAISYQFLGITSSMLSYWSQALVFFEEFNQLEEELHLAYPQNVEFQNLLAISYQFLGNTHIELGHIDQALTFFEYFNRLEKALHEAYPESVDFKNGLAVSLANLGTFNRDYLKNITQAKAYLQQAEVLWLDLVRDVPQNMQFRYFLGNVQKDLADL